MKLSLYYRILVSLLTCYRTIAQYIVREAIFSMFWPFCCFIDISPLNSPRQPLKFGMNFSRKLSLIAMFRKLSNKFSSYLQRVFFTSQFCPTFHSISGRNICQKSYSLQLVINSCLFDIYCNFCNTKHTSFLPLFISQIMQSLFFSLTQLIPTHGFSPLRRCFLLSLDCFPCYPVPCFKRYVQILFAYLLKKELFYQLVDNILLFAQINMVFIAIAF